jgi:hypothetical protein
MGAQSNKPLPTTWAPGGRWYDAASSPEVGSLDAWRLAYCAHPRGVAVGCASKGNGHDLVAERARLARAQADKTEIERAERRSKLLPVENALAAWQKLLAAFRAKYLALLAPEFATGVMPEPSKAYIIASRLPEDSAAMRRCPIASEEDVRAIAREYPDLHRKSWRHGTGTLAVLALTWMIPSGSCPDIRGGGC